MKKRFLLFVLSVLCSLCFQVAAQERLYMVTETELTRLESISENLARDRQSLQSQANGLTEHLRAQESKAKSLTEKLQKVENTANDLRNQLQTEQATLKNLRTSYNKSEQEAAKTIAKQQATIAKQKDTLHWRMIAIIILSGILIMIVVAIGVTWFIKGKLSFLRPP